MKELIYKIKLIKFRNILKKKDYKQLLVDFDNCLLIKQINYAWFII